MAGSVERRPSERLDRIGPTTPGNNNIALYVGHEDGPALNRDYGADISGSDTSVLGTQLNPVTHGSTRKSVLQLNHGGAIEANVKGLVRNIFAYEQRKDDHHPPADWEGFLELFKNQDKYIQQIQKEHSDVYMFATSKEGLVTAMKTDGAIGVFKSVEGFPQHMGVQPWRAAHDLASSRIQVVDLMWNYNTAVGDSHTTVEDNGLTRLGFEFLRECAEYGIPVFDVSHASPRTAMDMITAWCKTRISLI